MNQTLPTLLLLSMSVGACAQDVKEADVPAAVKTAFTQKFPKAEKTKWEMEDKKDYEANFKEAGTERSATFDAQGKWLESETEIKQADLPAEVGTALDKMAAGRNLKEFERVETPDRGTLYEVEMEKGGSVTEVQFDATGKVLATKMEDEDED